MKEYRLDMTSRFVHPHWLNRVKGREFEVVVGEDGALEVEGEKLRFASDTLPAGTAVVVSLYRWMTCVTVEDRERFRREAAEAEAAKRAADRERLNHRRDRARAQAASLTLPVRWVPAIKDVLSGLSESSWGDGRNKATVEHILLLEPLIEGRLTRAKGDLLCTARQGSNGKRWSSGSEESVAFDGEGASYPPEITCKSCLKLAERWKS